jgi:hypothetical protein
MGLEIANVRRDSVNDENSGETGGVCWRKFKVVTTNILRNVKEEYISSLQELLNAYGFMKC